MYDATGILLGIGCLFTWISVLHYLAYDHVFGVSTSKQFKYFLSYKYVFPNISVSSIAFSRFVFNLDTYIHNLLFLTEF